MAIHLCPICDLPQDCDQAAFEYHVNSHLTDPRDSSSSSRPLPLAQSPTAPLGSSAADEPVACCPVCGIPFDFLAKEERDPHVNACMGESPSIAARQIRPGELTACRQRDCQGRELDPVRPHRTRTIAI
jgi:hypothetical protein